MFGYNFKTLSHPNKKFGFQTYSDQKYVWKSIFLRIQTMSEIQLFGNHLKSILIWISDTFCVFIGLKGFPQYKKNY